MTRTKSSATPRAGRCAAAVALAALLAGGCATTGPISASGRRIPPATLAAAEQRVEQDQVPAALRSHYLALYAEGRENEALHNLRLGLVALRAGYLDHARRALDAAIQDVDSLTAGDDAARRAAGTFVREQTKWFKGESYERSALFFYRGLIYLVDRDFGNASACFKRAQLHDITSDDAADFAGDWHGAEWALAFASHKHGFPAEAEAALARAATFSTRPGNTPPPQPDHNVLVVVEVGRGPQKFRAGQHGEQLRFREYPPAVRQVSIVSGGRVLTRAPAAENLFVQATTRGTREVDYILGGKAAFKEGTGVAAHALTMGAIIASQHRGDSAAIATGVLGGLAVLSAIASAAATPEADIRDWQDLPHSIYLLGLKLPPGPATFEARGLNAGGQVAQTVPVTTTIEPHDPLRVVFVRM